MNKIVLQANEATFNQLREQARRIVEGRQGMASRPAEPRPKAVTPPLSRPTAPQLKQAPAPTPGPASTSGPGPDRGSRLPAARPAPEPIDEELDLMELFHGGRR